MRPLFELDKRDYEDCTHSFARNSARSIIIRNGKVAMIHSQKYDYYKFPGGGIEPGESHEDALIREVREETGLSVVRETIREFGRVFRIQRCDADDARPFIQENFYYLCECDEQGEQCLDEYESRERFSLKYVHARTAIATNRADTAPSAVMREREARVLELMIKEKIV